MAGSPWFPSQTEPRVLAFVRLGVSKDRFVTSDRHEIEHRKALGPSRLKAIIG